MSEILFLILAFLGGGLVVFLLSRQSLRQRILESDSKLQRQDSEFQREITRLEKVFKDARDQEAARQAKYIEELLAHRFTLRMRSTRITLEVLNLNGDCISARSYEGLRTGAGLSMHFVDHRLISDTPGQSLKDVRLLTKSSTEGVTMDVVRESQATTAARIRFPDGATNSPEGVNYAFEYELSRGILMAREDVESAYAGDPKRCESFSHINAIQTDYLEIQVNFPNNYDPSFRGCAMVKNIEHPEQTKKLKVEILKNRMKLSIEKPLPGFTYSIDWISPTRAEINKQNNQIGTGGAPSADAS